MSPYLDKDQRYIVFKTLLVHLWIEICRLAKNFERGHWEGKQSGITVTAWPALKIPLLHLWLTINTKYQTIRFMIWCASISSTYPRVSISQFVGHTFRFSYLLRLTSRLVTVDIFDWSDMTWPKKTYPPTSLPPEASKPTIFRVAAPGTEKSSGWRAHKYIWIQIFSSSKLFPAAASSKLFRACLLLRSHQVEALQVLTLHMFVIKSSLLSTYEGGRALFQVSQWERCCCSTYPRHIQLDSTFTLHLKLS